MESALSVKSDISVDCQIKIIHSAVIEITFFIFGKFQCSLNMNRVASGTKLALKKATHVIFDLDGLLLGEFS